MTVAFTQTIAGVFKELAVCAGLALRAFGNIFDVHIPYLLIFSVYILTDKPDNSMSYLERFSVIFQRLG
jgi:hypothetical protein